MSLRLVPWASWAEWQAVGDALLAEPGPAASAALARVSCWRARGVGKLPLAVEVTAQLAELRGLDCPGSVLSEAALRSLYSLTLLRFVNGVTDAAQKGRWAAPVAQLARSAGLPPVLVDIRHEARLPGVSLFWSHLTHRAGDAQRAAQPVAPARRRGGGGGLVPGAVLGPSGGAAGGASDGGGGGVTGAGGGARAGAGGAAAAAGGL